MKSLFLLSVFTLISVGCAEGNCRQIASAAEVKNKLSSTSDSAIISSGPQDRVKVFKYDGSLQCGSGKVISPDEMRTQLKDIKIYQAENKADGLMHMQVCGSPTGKANVFEIDRRRLADAVKLGFKEWPWN